MKINRSNNTPIDSVKVDTPNQTEQLHPTKTGIASYRDSFEVAQQKGNSLFGNAIGGPIIGTMIGEAIGDAANDKDAGKEAIGSGSPFKEKISKSADDAAMEIADKQREVLDKEKKERTSERMDY